MNHLHAENWPETALKVQKKLSLEVGRHFSLTNLLLSLCL